MPTDNKAEIRRLEERIAQIKKTAESPATGWDFGTGAVVINKELNRLQIIFQDRPDEATIVLLKSRGFKWAPSQNAWQRQLTPNALRAAKELTGHTESRGRNKPER